MSAARVAVRYAKAFIGAAQAADTLETDLTGLNRFCDVVRQSSTLEKLLSNITVNTSQKANIMEAVGKAIQVPDLALRFLRVLAENKRAHIVLSVQQAVHTQLDLLAGVRSVKLTTAVPLSAEQLSTFKEQMERGTGFRVRVDARVDSEVLGGGVASMGSMVFDGSVRGHLMRLRKELVKEY